AAREQLYPLVGAPLSQLDSTNYRTMELQSRKLDVELPLEHYDQLGIYRRRGNRYFDFDAFDFVARADSLMPYRIPSASGYLSLYPARYQQLWSGRPNDNLQFLKPGESCDRYAGGWIDMQSIRYILTAPGTNSDKFQKIYDGPDLNIFENQNAVPRAAIVERVRVIGNGQDLIGELKKPEFNPRSQVFLEEDPDLKVSSIPLEASASIVDSSAETVQIRVNTNKDSVLVLADSYFPGWEAFVDQKPERIYRANYSFRAVVLKAGKH